MEFEVFGVRCTRFGFCGVVGMGFGVGDGGDRQRGAAPLRVAEDPLRVAEDSTGLQRSSARLQCRGFLHACTAEVLCTPLLLPYSQSLKSQIVDRSPEGRVHVEGF